MTSAALPLTSTRAGLAALIRAQGDGVAAQITHLAVGTTPGALGRDQTALRGELSRVPILSGQRLDAGFRVSARIEPGPAAVIHEVGVILGDGTLLAGWSDTAPLIWRGPYAAIDLAFELILADLPTDSLALTVAAPDSSIALGLHAATVAALARVADQMLALDARLAALERQTADPPLLPLLAGLTAGLAHVTRPEALS